MELTGLGVSDMQAIAKQDVRVDRAQKARSLTRGAGQDKASQVAEEFEAQFIAQMLENMFSTVEQNDVFGGGEAENTYRSLLVDEYGKLIVKAGGIGVADHIKRELLRFQEAPAPNAIEAPKAPLHALDSRKASLSPVKHYSQTTIGAGQ